MANLILLLHQYGVLIVFAVVLLEQIGLPIPAFPILIVAGALAVDGSISPVAVLAASLAACLISDTIWYQAGRRAGKRILALLCRISLTPDYCVSQTEDKFRRWGPKALVVAKFIPGFNTVAPPLAGAMGTGLGTFLSFSLAGGLLWSGVGIAIGAYFHTSIDRVLDILDAMGSTALSVLGILLLLFVLFKYVERRRFRQAMLIERISIEQLKGLIEQGHEPLLVDARSLSAQALEPAIPGAVLFNGGAAIPLIAALGKDRHIIVYCSCPNEVSAAQAAKQLHAHGYHQAKPLSGGLDALKAAWADAGSTEGSLPTV
jgi:membrane protein DedA with SNARE-associated domain/rhodanese-related sulfurtransferase